MSLNPYESPCPVEMAAPVARQRSTNSVCFRFLAGVLMVIATGWGVFCAVFVAMNPLPSLLIFGPGYLVLAAYVWRAFLPCPGAYPKGLWALSLAVQGTWLFICLTDGTEMLLTPFGIWWILATFASLGGLIYDGNWSIRRVT